MLYRCRKRGGMCRLILLYLRRGRGVRCAMCLAGSVVGGGVGTTLGGLTACVAGTVLCGTGTTLGRLTMFVAGMVLSGTGTTLGGLSWGCGDGDSNCS